MTTAPNQHEESPPAAALAERHEVRWYMTGQGSYFTAMGIQSVLVPWLVAVVLQETPERVGLIQMVSMLPMLIFLMVGGAAADRSELRGLLMRAQMAAVVPPLLLAAVIWYGYLSYWSVMAIVVMLSTLGAWIVPARDSLLTRVAMRSMGGRIPQAVAMALSLQFAGQVVGMLMATQADVTGAIPYLIAESALFGVAIFSTYHLAPAPSAAAPIAGDGGTRARFAHMTEGIRLLWRDDGIRPAMILMGFGGVLYVGVFMVVFPLLARDAYGGGSLEIALLTVAFFGGIGTSSFLLSQRHRPIRRQGRTIMSAMYSGSIAMIFAHFEPPFWLMFALVAFWGLSAGVSMSTARAMVQERASDSHRARMLAGFQIAMMGGGPIGSFAAGYVVKGIGLFNALLVPPALMAVLWLSVFFFTDLWRAESPSAGHAPAD